MDAKEYLKDMSRKESFINAKKLRLQALKDLAYHIPGPVISDMPKNKRRTDSKVEHALIKAADLEKEIKEDERSLKEMKAYMLTLIGYINNPTEESIIIKRYFEHEKWEDISVELCYSPRWIFHLHGSALDKLNRIEVK